MLTRRPDEVNSPVVTVATKKSQKGQRQPPVTQNNTGEAADAEVLAVTVKTSRKHAMLPEEMTAMMPKSLMVSNVLLTRGHRQ